MSPIKAEVKYYPFKLPMMLWDQQHYWVDEIKMNMLWLVKPEIDTLVHCKWEGDEVSRSIDTHLDKKLRRLLSGPPVEFMRDFMMMEPDTLMLTQCWPTGYIKTMWARAREANDRLIENLGVNVTLVDFKNKRKFG